MEASGGNIGLGDGLRFGLDWDELGRPSLDSILRFESSAIRGGGEVSAERSSLLRTLEGGGAEKDCSNGFGSRSKSARTGRAGMLSEGERSIVFGERLLVDMTLL